MHAAGLIIADDIVRISIGPRAQDLGGDSMIYALLVTATLSALFAGIALYALKVRNTYAILLLQFLVSFGASFAVAYYINAGVFTTEYIAGVCAIVSLVIFGVLYLLHKTIGPLENRTPGTLGQKMQHPHQRGHN